VSSTGRPDEVSDYAPRWMREGTAKPGNVIPLPTASQGDTEEDGASPEPVWRRAATPFDGDIRRWREEAPPSIAQRPTRELDDDDEPLFANPSTTRIFLPARIYLSNVGRHFKATALVVVAAFVLGLTAVFLFPYALRGLQSSSQPTPTAAPLDADASQPDSDGPAPFASRFGSAEQWPKTAPTARSARPVSNSVAVLQPAPAQQTVTVLQPAPAPAPVLQPAPAQAAPTPTPMLQPAPAAAPVLQPAPVVQTATVSAPEAETTTAAAAVVQTETVKPQSSTTGYVVANSEPSAQPEPQPRVEAQPVLQSAPPPQPQRAVARGRQALPPQPEPESTDSKLDPAEVGRLLSRGQAFLNQGDVSAARLALERVAEAGEARAALALGATYDPVILKRMGMVGIRPDVEKARSWYERAAALGSAEANQRLMALGR
jgi:hypothetical protein